MKQLLISAALLAFGASSMAATCTSNTPWTTLGPPGTQNFGQTFSATGDYVDCYTFNLSSAALGSGTTTEINISWDKLWIDVTNVSLYSGTTASGGPLMSDSKPGQFNFSTQAGGTYTLAVSSTVGKNFLYFNNTPVGYSGSVSTLASGPVASAVPEGDAYAMALAGILGVGGVAMTRRRLRG